MSSSEIQRAEKEVEVSTSELSHALDDLASATESKTRSVARFIDRVDTPRRKVKEWSASAQRMAIAQRERGREFYGRASATARARYPIVRDRLLHDRRVQFGIAGVVIGVGAFLVLRRRFRGRRAEVDIIVTEEISPVRAASGI